MKITVGQLKKVIHSQLAEAKTAKQGGVKKINEATFTKLIKKLIVEETEAIRGKKLNESADADVNKIQAIVQSHVDGGGTLIGLGPVLNQAGYKSSFSTEPIAMHMIKLKNGKFALCNKRYVDDPELLVGEIAGGYL